MHPHLRVAHSAPLSAVGTAEVRGAGNYLGALIARVMTFPRPGSGVPVELVVRETPTGTVWERRFGGDRVRTVQRAIGGYMVEHRGPGRLWFSVSVTDGAVVYESVCASVFGVALPRSMTPRVTGRVSPAEDGWQTQVEVSAPLLGLLCAYSVRMRAKP
ncbi:MAG: DUF4166 domain-containing protein [Fimbriimonadaceae bacterium]